MIDKCKATIIASCGVNANVSISVSMLTHVHNQLFV